jgi:GNAT superfamily N-acetyltransferase
MPSLPPPVPRAIVVIRARRARGPEAIASSPERWTPTESRRQRSRGQRLRAWNPGLDDAQRFLAADPDSFLAAEFEDEIVATVSCAHYGDSYAFIGFYIARPDLRGQGIGSPLFERALERAGKRSIGLDGVLDQQAYYERRGFVLAHRNIRCRTTGGGRRPGGVVELSSVTFEHLLAFDSEVFGAERESFLRAWVGRPAGHALACLDGEKVLGYGVLRPCRVGAKIGPLFADDHEVADLLLDALLATAGAGTEVFLDIPAANPRSADLRAGHAMEPSFETARMYRNGRPPEDLQRVFGVTTFEFG